MHLSSDIIFFLASTFSQSWQEACGGKKNKANKKNPKNPQKPTRKKKAIIPTENAFTISLFVNKCHSLAIASCYDFVLFVLCGYYGLWLCHLVNSFEIHCWCSLLSFLGFLFQALLYSCSFLLNHQNFPVLAVKCEHLK